MYKESNERLVLEQERVFDECFNRSLGVWWKVSYRREWEVDVCLIKFVNKRSVGWRFVKTKVPELGGEKEKEHTI